jgi:hypothetical protein
MYVASSSSIRQDSDCNSMFSACALDLFCLDSGSKSFFGTCAVPSGCKPLQSYFTSGAEMCTKMWGAGTTVIDTVAQLVMYFTIGGANPNDATFSNKPFKAPCSSSNGEVCSIISPTSVPVSAPAALSMCSEYSDNACCSAATTATLDALFNFQYMSNFQTATARCAAQTSSSMSTPCLNWFIARSCLSQCDMNASPYRLHENCNPMNKWEMIGMPIKATDCDSFYTACSSDYLPMPVGGNYKNWVNETTCSTIGTIYSSGQQMCELMFDGAFVYEPVAANGYSFMPVGASKGIDLTNNQVVVVHNFAPVCSPRQGEVCTLHNAQTLNTAAPIKVPITHCGAWKDNGKN